MEADGAASDEELGFRALLLRPVEAYAGAPDDGTPQVSDLEELLNRLDLQGAALVGRGDGVATIVRCLAATQSSRIRQAVLVELPWAPSLGR